MRIKIKASRELSVSPYRIIIEILAVVHAAMKFPVLTLC